MKIVSSESPGPKFHLLGKTKFKALSKKLRIGSINLEAWIHLERPVSFFKKLSELVSAHTSLDLKRLNFRSGLIQNSLKILKA